jgi:hypothetical protein
MTFISSTDGAETSYRKPLLADSKTPGAARRQPHNTLKGLVRAYQVAGDKPMSG